jgi:hypothetical protein
MALPLILMSATWLLSGCGRESGGAHPLNGAFYPLDLALICDQSTPSPLRNERPARDGDTAFGNICVERDSGPSALRITNIDIYKEQNFDPPIYEVRLFIGDKDRNLMEKAASEALHSRRPLAFMVHGSVVAQAAVMGLPKSGMIVVGGFGSAKEANAMAARFEISPAGQLNGIPGADHD